ncbi:MAG: class I SAM-dependent methyltransferase [Alphaproteobacteria bacterium]|jgi:ubiquinone/menaquinone biosynthesis C-methylase UbiE|nr:class I SAM-dependent methyltransferase [Alphaproteobacteria bacterium]
MDARLQKRVQRYGWNRASDEYAYYWQVQLQPVQTQLLEIAALQPGERVLDVACGDGLVSFRAGEQVGADGQVVGDDISEHMVERADALRQERGVDNLRFKRRDGETPVEGDAAFDVALCALGLMYMPDPIRAMTVTREALRPGGRAVAAVWGQRSACGWAGVFPIVDARVASDVCPMFFNLGTGDALETVLREAGFTQVASERLSYPLHFDTPRQACGAALVGGPVALAYARFDEPTREEARDEYLASIAPYRVNGHYEIPGEFVVTYGIAPG